MATSKFSYSKIFNVLKRRNRTALLTWIRRNGTLCSTDSSGRIVEILHALLFFDGTHEDMPDCIQFFMDTCFMNGIVLCKKVLDAAVAYCDEYLGLQLIKTNGSESHDAAAKAVAVVSDIKPAASSIAGSICSSTDKPQIVAIVDLLVKLLYSSLDEIQYYDIIKRIVTAHQLHDRRSIIGKYTLFEHAITANRVTFAEWMFYTFELFPINNLEDIQFYDRILSRIQGYIDNDKLELERNYDLDAAQSVTKWSVLLRAIKRKCEVRKSHFMTQQQYVAGEFTSYFQYLPYDQLYKFEKLIKTINIYIF